MKEKYLPIGTVVLLKDATKEVMITGLAILGGASETVTDSEGNEKHLAKIWDYSGSPYPEGLITTTSSLLGSIFIIPPSIFIINIIALSEVSLNTYILFLSGHTTS